MRTLSVLAGLFAALAVAAPAQAATFTAGTFVFEQDDTPDVLNLLGNSQTLNGVTFSSGVPSNITGSVAFPPAPTSFMPELSLGRQANAQQGVTQGDGSSCSGACAVNLPSGNNGLTTRHGLSASWTGSRGLVDQSGVDFVIYESASSSTADEGFMVTLQLSDGSFTGWRYEMFDAFESYTGGSAGAMATAFDLADFGIGSGDTVTAIHIANMMPGDTLDGTSGNILFDGTGTSHGFGSSTLDPDPLYIGILNGLTTFESTDAPAPGALPLFAAGLGAMMLGWRRRRA
ncbi:MAG: hypothetical protein RIM84_20805 [Alphaproteobacteria bacterium]